MSCSVSSNQTRTCIALPSRHHWNISSIFALLSWTEAVNTQATPRANYIKSFVLRNDYPSYAKYSHIPDTNTSAATSLLVACIRNGSVLLQKEKEKHSRINRAFRDSDSVLESRVIARRFVRVTIYEPTALRRRDTHGRVDPHQRSAVGGYCHPPSRRVPTST